MPFARTERFRHWSVRARETITSRRTHHRHAVRRPSTVLAATTVAALATALVVPGTAAAGPADSSTATGRFLGGSVLGLPLDPIVSLDGATATNDGAPDPVTVVAPLSVTVLQTLQAQALPEIGLPLGDLIRIGVANQYAQASDDGVSRAASGAVSDDGGVSVNGSGAFPADASLNLQPLLGSDITAVLGDLDLRLGAITGVAAADAAIGPPLDTSCADLSAPVNCRDYAIADAELTLTSPVVAGVTGLLTGPTGVAAAVDTAVAGLSGPNGLLARALATVVSIPGLVGNAGVEATVTTTLRSALTTYLATPLVSPSGAVTVNLGTGVITADLDTLLTDAGGAGLASLAPNTDLLRAAVLAELVDQIGDLLNTVPAAVQGIVTTALDAAQVRVAANVCVVGTGSPCSGLGATGVQVLAVGTVAQFVAGTAPATLAVQAAGLPVTIGVGALLAALAAPLTATLLPLATSTIPAVTAGVGTILTALDPVLRGLGSIVALTGNVQENGAPGLYREVALRVSLLGGLGGVVDLGRADVGPNVDFVLPTASALSPNEGPAAGGTIVTVTGSDFVAGETTVTIDGTTVPATVVSPTQLTFATPAHIPATVDVTVATAGGVGTPPLPFTYLPVPAPVIEVPAAGSTVGTATPVVSGTGVDGTVTVTEGAAPICTATVVDGAWSCTATAPLANGPHTVVATQTDTADNQSAPSVPVSFTVAVVPVVAALSPAAGPVAGGQTVTVAGTGFEPGAVVTVDGTAVPSGSVTVVDATTLSFVSPAHPAGPVEVTVTTTGGVSPAATYTYVAVPTATAASPSSGPQAGGQTVTVAGTGFVPGATTVTVDGATVPELTVVSPTEVTFVSPPHPEGEVPVVVTTPGGSSAPLPYTYLPLPAITALSPAAGPVTGGQTVTATGTGFEPGTIVTVDGTAVPSGSVTVIDATTLTFVSPAHPAGPVDVTVTTTGGVSPAAAYTYVDAPVVASIDPVYGPVAGGITVTVIGDGFVPGATVVIVDGLTVSEVTVVSPTELTLTTPAHPAGPVPVSVVTAGGASAPLPFVYLPVPTLTSASPSSGPQAGGQTVTVTGDGFVPGLTLTVDGVPVDGVTVLSATELFFVSPPHAEGQVPVVVTTPGGSSAPLPYTYLPLPAISGLSPTAGPVAGGQTVTVTGTGFEPGAVVTVDGLTAADVVVASPTSLSFTTPAHPAGPVEVTVTTTGGVSPAAIYTYVAVPTATAASPSSGPQAGGQTVTVTGTGFVPGATTVTVDGATVPGLTVVSPTEVTFVSPPHAEGEVPVVVTTPGGSSAPLPYTYLPLPAITALSPAAGPVTGGQTVTVTGTGFEPGTVVTVDGTAVPDVTVVSPTSLTFTTPAHPAGPVEVTVSTGNGTSTAADYTYLAVPVVSALDPGYGPTAGGQTVTLTGDGFVPGGTVVLVDGTPATGVVVDPDGTSLTFVTPAHPAGAVPVTVVTAGGEATPPVEYLYAAAPTVTGLDPTSGPAAGGQTVTVTGSGFVAGSTIVTVDAGTADAVVVPAADVTVIDAATLTFVTPAHPAGPATVTVQTAAGSAAPQDYTYLGAPAPTVTGLAPATGPLLGGTVVTVTGTGFVPGVTSVVFDSLVVPAGDVTVTGPTTLTFVTPPGTLGGSPVTVSVTNDDTAGVDAGTFTYAPPVIDAASPVTPGAAVAVSGTGWPAGDQVTIVLRTPAGIDVPGATVTVITTAEGELPAGTAVPVPDSTPIGVYAAVAEDEDSNRAVDAVEVVAGTPVVTGISPDRGPLAGGTVVTLAGSGFTAGAEVLVAGVRVVPTTVTPTGITFTVPAGAVAGPVDVVVDNGGGALSEPVTFTYDAPSVNPTAPVVPGGTTVVSGGGFPPNTPVTVVVVDGQGTPVTSPVTVTTDATGAFSTVVTVPAGTPLGSYSVVVRDGNGNSAGGTVTVIATSGTNGGSGGSGNGGSGNGGAGGGGSLAYTGEPVGRLIPIGLLLLLAGVGLLVVPVRRSRRRG